MSAHKRRHAGGVESHRGSEVISEKRIKSRHDLTVLGLGGMGSATLAHPSSRGHRVLGIERFAYGHDLGSSSGHSRIIRKAYFEDPAYVGEIANGFGIAT